MTMTYERLKNTPEVHTLRAHDLVQARKILRDVRDSHGETMRRLLDVAAGRDLTRSQQYDFDAAERALLEAARIAGKVDDELFMRTQREGVVATGAADSSEYRDGVPLSDQQTVSGFVRSRGLVRESEERLSLPKYLRGALFGDWRGADAEQRAMSGLTSASGGVLVPPVLAAQIVDKARAATRVLEAGARIVPMSDRQVDIARWVEDPEPTWRAEGAPITVDDAALDALTLKARTLAVVTKVTRELLEDAAEVEAQLLAAFGAAFAAKIDGAALYGSGTGEEPTGLVNTSGVNKTNVAANGGPPTWDLLVDSVGRVRDAAENPTAQIMADRTARSLAKLKESGGSGAYLPAPSYLDGVRRLTTPASPVNLTTGTSTDTSDVFTGDFSQLYVGVRTELVITPLRERFMVEEGSIGLVAWFRGDIGVARPKAFDIVRGVRS